MATEPSAPRLLYIALVGMVALALVALYLVLR